MRFQRNPEQVRLLEHRFLLSRSREDYEAYLAACRECKLPARVCRCGLTTVVACPRCFEASCGSCIDVCEGTYPDEDQKPQACNLPICCTESCNICNGYRCLRPTCTQHYTPPQEIIKCTSCNLKFHDNNDCATVCYYCNKKFCNDCVEECESCGNYYCKETDFGHKSCAKECSQCKTLVCPNKECGCSASECHAPLCDNCKNECHICDKILCDDHTEECHDCGHATCSEHLTECPIKGPGGACDNKVCEECGLTTCHACQEQMCGEHVEDCNLCGEKICNDCIQECVDCQQTICKDCKEVCEHCSKDICKNCIEGHNQKHWREAQDLPEGSEIEWTVFDLVEQKVIDPDSPKTQEEAEGEAQNLAKDDADRYIAIPSSLLIENPKEGMRVILAANPKLRGKVIKLSEKAGKLKAIVEWDNDEAGMYPIRALLRESQYRRYYR